MTDLRHFLPSNRNDRFTSVVEATQTGELQAAVIDSLNPYYLVAEREVYFASKLINLVVPTFKELDANIKPCSRKTIADALHDQQLSRADIAILLDRADDARYVTRSSDNNEPPASHYQLTLNGRDLQPAWVYEHGKPPTGCAGGLAIGGLASAMNVAVFETRPLVGAILFAGYTALGSAAVHRQTAKHRAKIAHRAYLEHTTK